MYQRGCNGRFYLEDNTTGKQESLGTSDRSEAERLLHARNEAQRQQMVAEMAQSLNPTYTVRNGLRVSAREQGVVDQALANRTIEFEPGSAVLRPAGQQILNEMATALLQLRGRRVTLIGHTDALGARGANVSLSLARAQAVKDHLVARGVPADSLSTSGMGPDQPVASNASEEGRARNRRIEFRVGA